MNMKEIILLITMWIVTACTYISYIPQIVKLIKTKKSEDLSIVSWILWTVSSLANFVYSVVLGRHELIIASVSEFLLILVTLILTIYYGYKCERQFQERINKIRTKDGNHMILLTAITEDRKLRSKSEKY